jgi:hypothetical protein
MVWAGLAGTAEVDAPRFCIDGPLELDRPPPPERRGMIMSVVEGEQAWSVATTFSAKAIARPCSGYDPHTDETTLAAPESVLPAVHPMADDGSMLLEISNLLSGACAARSPS